MINEYEVEGDTIVHLTCDQDGCENHIEIINPTPFGEDPAEDWTSVQISREDEEEPEVLEVLCPTHSKTFG